MFSSVIFRTGCPCMPFVKGISYQKGPQRSSLIVEIQKASPGHIHCIMSSYMSVLLLRCSVFSWLDGHNPYYEAYMVYGHSCSKYGCCCCQIKLLFCRKCHPTLALPLVSNITVIYHIKVLREDVYAARLASGGSIGSSSPDSHQPDRGLAGAAAAARGTS